MANLTGLQLQLLDDIANEAQIQLHLLSLARANTTDAQRQHADELAVHVLTRSPDQVRRMEACRGLSVSSYGGCIPRSAVVPHRRLVWS